MKIKKRASQQNFILDTDYLITQSIKRMLDNEEIFFIVPYTYRNQNPGTELTSSDFTIWQMTDQPELRIDVDHLNEVKVVLEDDGFYHTVAVGKDGTVYHINL